MVAEGEEGFFARNGKKFVTVIVGGLCLTAMAMQGLIDPMVPALYWFGAGGISAGAISRS